MGLCINKSELEIQFTCNAHFKYDDTDAIQNAVDSKFSNGHINIFYNIYIYCIFMGYPLVKFGANRFIIQGDTECDTDRWTDRQTQGDSK